jgi:hypothetical protein
MKVLYIDNDMIFELRALKDALTGAAVTGATVTVTLKDSDNQNVTGVVDLAMAHVGDGTYRVAFEDTLPLATGDYTAWVTAISGSTKGFWKFSLQAAERVG